MYVVYFSSTSVFSQSPVVLATYWLFESLIVSLREQNLISTVQGPENQGPTESLDAHLYLLLGHLGF
jgi:hypothetical protein